MENQIQTNGKIENSRELEFAVFCIENIAASLGTPAEKVYLALTEKQPHGKICLAFTPDEEIGRGADAFDVAGFGAKYAYTVDGGTENEIEYENFNAAKAEVRVRGFSVHPGDSARLHYIIRDHDAARFAGRQEQMRHAAKLLNERYGAGMPSMVPASISRRKGWMRW